MLIVGHLVHLVASVHPHFHLDVLEPIGNCGYAPTAVLFDMLLTDIANRDCAPIAIDYRATENPLGLKDALRMVSERTMPRVCKDLFGRIEPLS